MSETVKPVWLLDVDGVINVVNRKELVAGSDLESGVALDPDQIGWKILWHTTIIDRINALSDVLDIHWLTTWKSHAQSQIAPLVGLNRFPVLPETSPRPNNTVWWKRTQVAVWQNTAQYKRPLVWTDDELYDWAADTKWAQRQFPGSLIIGPKEKVGLTHEHLDQIEAWVESLR